jgi:hypothetical protein
MNSIAIGSVSLSAAHEIGHQFVATTNHVDTQMQVNNHAGTDKCTMTYAGNKENGLVESCADHLFEIRDDTDPR